MALVDHPQSESLPCGTLLDDLIAQITDGAAPLDRVHQAACRYCQSTLQAIQEAWEEFQQLARAAVAVPEDLLDRVMSRVRGLGRADGAAVRIADRHGQTRIAGPVVAKLARSAALDVAGVRWVTVQSAGEAAEQPGSIEVGLRLVASYGPELQAISAEVRRCVADALRSQAGASVARVDVVVEDIVVDEDNFEKLF